ncbi:MAG TPA: CheR family methyltransferase, partial [Byssovorax sp.]
IRVRTGHDFSSYKRATLYRRIARRMQVCDTGTLLAYLHHLRDHATELTSLLRDLLIGVTSFFRDPAAFAALEEHVVARVFAAAAPDEPVRAWVAGCATGEEAFTVAMLLLERAGGRDPTLVQVFATDIDEDSLAIARAGRYPDTIALDVTPARLERFFTKERSHYRVRKELRERVLFSPHNVLRDPPFSRLDLVTCRNLLIYLNRDAQERVLGMFQFALRSERFLFLGSSESAETPALHFSALDAKHRIYVRQQVTSSLVLEAPRWRAPFTPPPEPQQSRRTASFGELHHLMVERYAPPSVLVDDELDVVHVSESVGRYLSFSGGEPTRQILQLVHPDLRLELRTALYAARRPGHRAERRVVELPGERGATRVELTVSGADLPNAGRKLLLVLFRELPEHEASPPAHPPDPAIEPFVREMEDELHRTKDQLRVTVEQYETSLEELKASNEELHAINEELRSATEELETSREELQSVNEELTTLNHELQGKVEEVSRANGDLQNLMTSTDIAVLFLDRDLHIKRFTERAKDIFNVIASDVERPFAHLTHQLVTDSLSTDAERVLATLRPLERELSARDGRRYLARILPYRSLQDRIEGVVMTFLNVSDLKRAEDALRDQEAKLSLAERAADAGSWDFDAELGTIALSHECARLFGVAGRVPLRLRELASRVDPLDRDAFLEAFERVSAPTEELCVDFRVGAPGATPRWLFSVGRRWTDGAATRASGVVVDFTARRRAEAELRASERRFRLALHAAPIMVLSQDVDLRYAWGFVHGAEIDFVDQTDADVFRSDEAAELVAVKRAVLATKSRRRLELALTLHGSTRAYEVHVDPILDGDVAVGVTSVALDVTASKDAARALLDADRRKDQFLATLSHELRTPLAPLRASVDMLRIAGGDPERVQRSLAIMDRQLVQLVRLVDDLLDVARISAGKIQLRRERARVEPIVASAVESVQPALALARHALSVDAPATLEAFVDPARLAQVLGNLLMNAIKFTPPGGVIRVVARESARGIELSVHDNGAGISAHALTGVFDMYAQEGRLGADAGLGIGLNLVRLLVELHGGTAEARSDGVGKGSEFVVRIPRPSEGGAAA